MIIRHQTVCRRPHGQPVADLDHALGEGLMVLGFVDAFHAGVPTAQNVAANSPFGLSYVSYGVHSDGRLSGRERFVKKKVCAVNAVKAVDHTA